MSIFEFARGNFQLSCKGQNVFDRQIFKVQKDSLGGRR